MRHQKDEKIVFTISNRHRAAYRRKVLRLRQKYPLLELIGELEIESEAGSKKNTVFTSKKTRNSKLLECVKLDGKADLFEACDFKF